MESKNLKKDHLYNATLDFSSIAKRRFHSTFHELQSLLKKAVHHEIDMETLFSEVKLLFAGDEDLILRFGFFFEPPEQEEEKEAAPQEQRSEKRSRSTSIDNETPLKKKKKPLKNEDCTKQILTNAVEACVRYIKRAKNVMKDDEYREFIDAIIGFTKHEDVGRFEVEVFPLFREYPRLKKDLCEKFIGTSVEEGSSKVEKNTNAVSQFQRNPEETKLNITTLSKCEDKMNKFETSFNCIKSTEETAMGIMRESASIYLDMEENIDIGNYLSGFNLKCVDKELKGTCMDKGMPRLYDIEASPHSASFLEKEKIKELAITGERKIKELPGSPKGNAKEATDSSNPPTTSRQGHQISFSLKGTLGKL